jgi:hypothetical protein
METAEAVLLRGVGKRREVEQDVFENIAPEEGRRR